VRKIIFLTRAHSVSAWGFFQLPTRISAGNSAGCRCGLTRGTYGRGAVDVERKQPTNRMVDKE
jgi:hypothetical protein